MLSILSFNIFNNNGNIKKFTKEYLTESVINPDIICTQEDNTLFNLFGNNYSLLINCGSGAESVAVYYNINTIKKSDFTSIKKIRTSQKGLFGISPRNAIIFTIRGITIANLHLEGGRCVDKVLLTNLFDIYLKYKIGLLESILLEKPDVICGDFNSVYSSTIFKFKEYLTKQLIYFSKNIKKQKLTNEENNKIKIWNIKPYKLLAKNGYLYSKPYNESDSITTSRGNTIIDSFWINNKILQQFNNKTEIINLGPLTHNWLLNDISDHNPIFLKLY